MADDTIEIREVWEHNLESEFSIIREIVHMFPYVAIDTEFPGAVFGPSSKPISSDGKYQQVRANVDILKLIQLGLTFSDEHGNLPFSPSDPTRKCVWQFNFREFDPDKDKQPPASIKLLRESGIDFSENLKSGVDAEKFVKFLCPSRIVLIDEIKWITFDGAYDFGFMLKLLGVQPLPETQVKFLELINVNFPMLYDIKHLMKFTNYLHGGLKKLAKDLQVERVGTSHQSGSDSLVTAGCFHKLRKTFFNGSAEKYSGVICGLGVETAKSSDK